MVEKVKKRDGSLQKFDLSKIVNAIDKAFHECSSSIEETNNAVLNFAQKKYMSPSSPEVLHVEQIQDDIEIFLMENYPVIAKHFIIYRYNHKIIRENRDLLVKGITKKLMATDVKNQNANVDEYSFGGRIGEASGLVNKDYALKYCMSKKARENHLNNMIYIHDLDMYAVGSHNCLSVPFDKLLKKGFRTRQVDIRAAQSISSAMQLVAVVFQLQSLQQFGGVSATHIDWSMVPFLRKTFYKHYSEGLEYIVGDDGSIWRNEFLSTGKIVDSELPIEDDLFKKYPGVYKYAMDMTLKDTNQATEAMYHNLNSLQSRSGNQLPFTSINYGTCTLPEGRIIIKALLNIGIKGLGPTYKTSIFPCCIFQYKKGINDKPGTPNYDLYQLALKCTSQRLYPNYANVDWTTNTNATKQDREDKRKYIESLSQEDQEKLIKILEERPELKDALLLDIVEE